MNSQREGLLVVAHGTRDRQGQAEFHSLLGQIALLLPDVELQGAFLEKATPTIADALPLLAQRGVHEAAVMPLLLFAAGHAKHDIPSATRRAAQRCHMQVHFLPVLGNHPHLLALSAQRLQSALQQHQAPAQLVQWIFVGRGCQDPSGIAQFLDFFQQRKSLTPVGQAHHAFLAAARPTLESALAQAATSPLPWVALQPHLLFSGRLQQRLERLAREQDQCGQRQRWLVTEHLGADPVVAEIVRQRYLDFRTAPRCC